MKLKPIVLLSLLAACAPGADNPKTETELAKLDNGDGTWSYALDPSFERDALDVQEKMTWRYVGQAKFDHDPQPLSGEVSYLYQGDKAPSLREQLMQTRRTDEAGRIWAVAEIDDSLLQQLPKARLDAEPDLEPSLIDREEAQNESDVPEPEIGQVLTWTPMTWTNRNCDGDDVRESRVWDADDRVRVGSPALPRGRTAVSVNSSVGGCTGTMLRSRWVLTAAHCIVGSGDNLATSITVTNFAGEVRTVSTPNAFPAPGFNFGGNGWDPNDDYALLKISSSFTSAVGDMDISSASNARINLVDDRFHNLGFPEFFPACTPNSSLVSSNNGEITGMNNRNVRWRGDGGTGHSGGPVYYCPGAPSVTACDGDDKGFVVGVWAGWSNYYSRFIGARGRFFRDWAVTIMNTQ